MKNKRLIPLDLHMLCVVRSMAKGSVNISAPNVVSRTLKKIVMCCTLAKLQKVGEHQKKGEMEEIKKEIEVGEMTEARPGVWRDEVIEVMIDVGNLPNGIRETSLLNLLETESKK